MKKDIEYITIDGRGEHDSFRDCLTQAVKDIKPNEGIHVIKDFEPFPMYKMMSEKGFDKFVEKVSDDEFHVYFYRIDKLEKIKMTENLDIDEEKINKIISIKLDFINGNISLAEAKERMKASFEKITAKEFAICEQYLQKYGITDEVLAERMDEILEIFEGLLVSEKIDLPSGHPIKTYLEEVEAIRKVLSEMKIALSKKFIKNQWLEIYDKLAEIKVHFSRKQNQLFPAMESKGFDKPSKVMWTLDNNIREIIRKSRGFLEQNKYEEFIGLQEEVIEMVEDMMVKEEEILLPTSMDLLSDEDFIKMRKSDDEIGYCLIKNPAPYGNEGGSIMKNGSKENEFMKDMAAILQKHGMLNSSKENEVLDVAQGELTLSQINLIFKHLQVDLSYVDENEIVKFYSDTKHRVFPRSAGVIGREVQNCHPRESVEMVEEIIRAFRAGEQDEAEFWLEINGKFIYIIYNAVRDEEGNFKGVLEMMQDVTKIRSLTGSQRLLSWTNKGAKKKEEKTEEEVNEYGLTTDSIIGDIVKKYPYIKNFLLNLSPKFSKLKNPILFKTMSSMATIEMISQRGGLESKEVLSKIVKEIQRNS